MDLMDHYSSIVDIFAPFSNVLGFFVGTDIPSTPLNSSASAFVKCAVRDMKTYISDKSYRQIPVGYAASDNVLIRNEAAAYFQCGSSGSSIDFYGLDNYEWCGQSSFSASGYESLTEEFSNYPIPAFFSEFGCNTVQPRLFTEVQALYSSEMTDVWSGGIVYEWFEESDDYGLVTQIGSSVSPLPAYTALSVQFNNVTPSSTSSGSYTPTNTHLPCPTFESTWLAATNLPPTPNEAFCECIQHTFGCVASSPVGANTLSQFNLICGDLGVDCSVIEANGTAPGSYGAYSSCNVTVRLSWAFNEYWLLQSKTAAACDFGGQATIQSPSSVAGDCVSLLTSSVSTGGFPSPTGGQVPSVSTSSSFRHFLF